MIRALPHSPNPMQNKLSGRHYGSQLWWWLVWDWAKHRRSWLRSQPRGWRSALLFIAIDTSENWSLRGLYWLSKDFFESNFQQVIEPDARALNELRNHLEHKYVKVHGILVTRSGAGDATPDPFFDSFAHSVSREDLERRTLRLLKLVRSALIYLSLGMHHEEKRRRLMADPGAKPVSMRLDPWEDE